jgi:succinate dehydrogenase flavin-adding protein (antitoxin of CptAB toxin-antitoxin module)
MDSIVASVLEKFKQRSEVGQQKYGTTLDRTDLKFLDWVNHMQEELMDAILYLEKLKKIHSEKDVSYFT